MNYGPIASHLVKELDISKVTDRQIVTRFNKISRKLFKETHLKLNLKEFDLLSILLKSSNEINIEYEKIILEIEKQARKKSSEKEIPSELGEFPMEVEAYTPLIDVRSGDQMLYSEDLNEIVDIKIEVWEKQLSKDQNASFGLKNCLFEYDPYNLASFVETDHAAMKVLRVNTYKPPAWRVLDPPEEIECPELAKRLLEHLFPDELCRDFVVDWMYLALVERNETYLVLNGAKGIGKGVFCSLLSCLVGLENYNEIQNSVLTSQFNAGLEDKRLIVMDEFKVAKKEHSRLKKFINKYQAIEKKGIDATKAKEIFNSYIISNNDLNDMYVEWDDRRFSVADMNKNPLKKAMKKSEITKLLKLIEHDETFAWNFGYWVYSRKENIEYDSFSEYKGKRFFELVYNSLFEWQKFVVDKIETRESRYYDIESLQREYNRENKGGSARFPRNPNKVDGFLENYSHGGEYIMGRVGLNPEDTDEGLCINVAEEFWPEDKTDLFGEEEEEDLL